MNKKAVFISLGICLAFIIFVLISSNKQAKNIKPVSQSIFEVIN